MLYIHWCIWLFVIYLFTYYYLCVYPILYQMILLHVSIVYIDDADARVDYFGQKTNTFDLWTVVYSLEQLYDIIYMHIYVYIYT